MAVFKCKMCGGTLEVQPGASVGECEYCGTQQTLPRLDDERRANLYDRANHFRRNNDFDKAMAIYEQVLNDDPTDAEAYWSLVLCRYGIEYVEDPMTHKRLPTVNRAQFVSVFADEDYRSALQHADEAQRALYEKEAQEIDTIQKGILQISQKEEPFDIFICYKETDANGRRTMDSVLATDLYHQLTNDGYKVFFARFTLEDKLGSAYEPYIFAALNSAKVMVVLGTRPEYFNAVWVKNEWSRYLALIRKGEKKLLIPAYRDMDPYDLPEEFSHLQAQDMSKLGFMQDLVRGINKIINQDVGRITPVKSAAVADNKLEPLIKRMFMFLEDGEWDSANQYCERVLDTDPENAQAYLGKLMAELHVGTPEALKDCKAAFDQSNNYKKALRFADESLKKMLLGSIEFINKRNADSHLREKYDQAVAAMLAAKSEHMYKAAAQLFEAVAEYADSAVLALDCLEKAETARKDALLDEGRRNMQTATVISYERAIKCFEDIPGWKDADAQLAVCREKLQELKVKEEKERIEREHKIELLRQKRKRNSKIALIVTAAVCAVMIPVYIFVLSPLLKYNDAVLKFNAQDYDGAIELWSELGDYRDSAEQIKLAKHSKAIALFNGEFYYQAKKIWQELGDYSSSEEWVKEATYYEAMMYLNEGAYDSAVKLWDSIADYKDSTEMKKYAKYYQASVIYETQPLEAIAIYESLGNYKESKTRRQTVMRNYLYSCKSISDPYASEFVEELCGQSYDKKKPFSHLFSPEVEYILLNNKSGGTNEEWIGADKNKLDNDETNYVRVVFASPSSKIVYIKLYNNTNRYTLVGQSSLIQPNRLREYMTAKFTLGKTGRSKLDPGKLTIIIEDSKGNELARKEVKITN